MLQETFWKNIFMVKRMKKVFPICCCRYCRQYLKQIIVLPSKIMKYHILKISTTRVTVTQTDLKMRTCVFMPSFIQSITSPGVAKCKVSFIVVYNLISVQRKPLSLYGVGMTGWFSVYTLHKDNIKHQKTIFSCFLKIGQSGLTKAFVAKNFAIFDQ